MLGISNEKLAQIIRCAKDHDTKTHSWTDALESGFSEESEPHGIPAYEGGDEPCELAELLGALDEQEQASVLALAWVGRGIFPPEEIAEATEAAKAEAVGKPATVLMGIPMLADYLEDGLDKLAAAA